MYIYNVYILFKKFKIYKNIFEKDTNNRIINTYKFNNCIITGINLYYPNVLIYSNNNLILPLLEKTMSLKRNTIYEENNMTFDFNLKNIKEYYKTPLFFFVYNTDNYFHFLYDTLPYLISYFELKKKILNLKLLMQYPNPQKNKMYPFILEFLEILNIKKDDIIILNNNIIYNEIYISTSYTHDIDSNLPPRKEIYTFYKDIVKSINNINIKTPSKIYISRRSWLHNNTENIGTNYTTRRKMMNENKIVEKIKKEGYKEIFTENLSTIEKIKYFSNATYIIGAIGGGVANVLFSPKTTKLEVYVSPTFLDINKRFKFCLDIVNVKYNMNTIHFEKTKFKKYMRVKILYNNIIGEIEEVLKDEVIISYTDGSNTGWNNNIKYNKKKIKKTKIKNLDNGLNSPWILLNI